MAFAIMRFAKLKTGAPINGSVSHVARSRETDNADPKRRHLNYAIVGPMHDDASGIRSAIADRTPEKYRKDAVRVLEFVITATPDWFEENPEQSVAYFDSAVDWLQDEFGAENVVSAVVHNDESTPHMHAYVVPVDPDSGKLNAKRLVGGRARMRELQSTFADHQSGYGVERGKPNPKRKHTPVGDWYDKHTSLDEREAGLEAREEKVSQDLMIATSVIDSSHNMRARLAERERELDKKAAQLAAAEEQFEQQKAAWISENKPSLPVVVQHLKHLETLGVIASAEYLKEQDNDQLFDLFSPQEGLTGEGRALLDRYKNVQERAEKFEETFTPSSGALGL